MVDLGGVEDHSHHLVDEGCTVRDNRLGLDCHLSRLEEQHHRVEPAGIAAAAAAHIRTAVGSMEGVQEEAVGEEDSCTAGCQPSKPRHLAAVSIGCKGQESTADSNWGSEWCSVDESSTLQMENAR